MTGTDFYQIDAFADQAFIGNPAAVYFSSPPLNERVMQKIAQENNLAETAFVSPLSGKYGLRWFTPTVEVPLCGHATLAAAHMLFHEKEIIGSEVTFDTKSGDLTVKKLDFQGGYQLNFPRYPVRQSDIPLDLPRILGVSVREFHVPADDSHQKALIVLETAEQVRQLVPDLNALKGLPYKGWIVTALSDQPDYQFISRHFGPAVGIDEDSVTGAAHCVLAPFWGERLKSDHLIGYQTSKRGGTIMCQLKDPNRVLLSGKCHTYLKGNIFF